MKNAEAITSDQPLKNKEVINFDHIMKELEKLLTTFVSDTE